MVLIQKKKIKLIYEIKNKKCKVLVEFIERKEYFIQN